LFSRCLLYFFLWWAVAGYKEEVVALLFFFKLGVGPFHFWLLRRVFFLKEKEIILFLGLQKSFLCVLRFFIYVRGALVVVLINFVLGAYLAFRFFKIWYLLFSSSFIHFGWLLVFIGLNLKRALVYYFYYVGALSFILLEEVGGGLIFFVYMGVPFSPLFFIKWRLFTVFSWSSLIAVGAVRVIIFFIYLRGVFYLLLKAFNKFMFVSYSLLYYFILGLFIML